MADSIEFTLVGMDKVLDNFDKLDFEVKRKGGRFALRKAANFIADKARQNAWTIDDPETANKIHKNIAVRWSGRTYKATGNLMFRVGVLGGAYNYANTKENIRKGRAGKKYVTDGSSSNPGGDTWYWRLLEFGTEKHKAQPFMRPALQNNIYGAINIFGDELEKKIARLLK